VKQISYNRLWIKLLFPLLLCCIAITALISVVTYFESKITTERYVKQQAIEFSESFLMATEVNSSRASIIRTTNSLGTYKGIKELFIIEERSERIIASSKNRYVGATLAQLPLVYRSTSIERVRNEGGKIFTKIDADHYLFAYRAKIISEDKRRTSSIVILMLLSSDGISSFLDEFRNSVMFYSALAFIGALLFFYLVLKLTLLNRINNIVEFIEKDSTSDEPRFCPAGSDDELGVLVNAYNKSLLSDHEHTKKLISANEDLAKLSYIDSLTGVSNRRNFDRILNDEWSRTGRHQQPITLMMIDVDHFKQFNDRYGHQAGDNCLKAVAATLMQQLKRPGDLLSRYGGEEFSIILPNTAESWDVVAESCRTAIEKLAIDLPQNESAVHVTVSIGAAYAVPQADRSPNELLELADQALYKAKQNGRNQVVLSEGSFIGTENDLLKIRQ
jgi:diguanylate cyclase (GGDEF)-like protein